MTPEWTVLITAEQSDSQDSITTDQSRQILESLGGDDSWLQYPPASGRGHGFEVRWWQRGDDAGSVAIEGVERYERAVTAAGLLARIVLVHVASAPDRLTEAVIGLERRAALRGDTGSWNVMLRAIAPPDAAERSLDRALLVSMLASMPRGESSGFARDGLAEVRMWVDAEDAVDAAERGAAALHDSLVAIGRAGWLIVRAHATSVAEATRAGYLGVQRRVLADDPASGRIIVRV